MKPPPLEIIMKTRDALEAGQAVTVDENNPSVLRLCDFSKDQFWGTAMEDIPASSEVLIDITTGHVRLKGKSNASQT